MVIRNNLIILLIGLCLSSTWAQSNTITLVDPNEKLNDIGIASENAYLFDIPLTKTISALKNAPEYKTQREIKGVEIGLVFPDGTPLNVQLHEAPISHIDHYNKYPENQTFKITGADNPFISGRLAISPRGVRGLIYTESQTLFIESVEGNQHVSYIYEKENEFVCEADMREHIASTQASSRSSSSIGDEILDYRIAIASSGEWSNERNNNLTTINDDINTYLVALNAIYEKELATTFTLIASNDNLIFFNAVTDGLSENNRTGSAHSVISGAIPSANYDIGHVFYEIDFSGGGATGSGVAGLGVVCKNSRKAEGWTGLGGNYNVGFFMSIFAHEVGHQFNAAHSFYGTSANCQGGNRSAGSGYEPGSGNSLMSYEGSCFQNGACTQTHNIVPQSNTSYFHANSLEQMTDYIDIWGCASVSTSSNNPPVVTVPANKYIPKSTPFEMNGSATDADGDGLVYNWEENDTDFLLLNCPDGYPNDAATSTTAPLFRSLDPTSTGNYRSFPQQSDITNNVQTLGEILPTIGRNIKLRLVARDFNTNIGGVGCADVTLTVDGNSGPFFVTVANDPNPAYQAGESVNITWDVNNTASSPINCSNVQITFSLDGGNTYPITLASSTANDGSHTVNMPSTGTDQGRIKVKAIDNYFFDINNEDITIISDCTVDGGIIINTESVSADAGDPILDLMLQSGVEITSVSDVLESSDLSANLNCEDENTNGCTFFGNTPKYKVITFTVDQTGNYTFSKSSPAYYSFLNLYQTTFDNTDVCSNWLASSGSYDASSGGISIGFSLTHNLIAGNTYVLRFCGFSGTNTGAYTISFSNDVGGKIYNTSGTAPAGYTSSYVVVNQNSIIKGIDTSPDMTDESVYLGGNYTIYGLSYISSNDLSGYVNGAYSLLQSDIANGTVCGDFSNNTKSVTINGCTPGIKTVTNTNGSGPGSLRTLMTEACPGDMIVFSSNLPDNSTITLATEIVLDRMMTVDASDINNLTLSGGFTSRIFQIPNGLSLTLKDLNLKNGFTSTNGGAFYNLGEVKLSNVTFENNFSGGDITPYTGNGEVIIESGQVLIKN